MNCPVSLSRSLLLKMLALLCLLASMPGYGDKVPAPAFPEDLAWLNVSRPLTLSDLEGRVTILDFWTYGCINCLHVVEELRALEQRFGDSLLVIGVHSPKFSNERRMDTLRRILLRYDRHHPVIQDSELELMRIYGVRAWPTLILIDTKGMVIGYVAGEGHGDLLGDLVTELLREADRERPALPLLPETERIAGQPLAAPGKIIAGAGELVISDTLHHRIIVTSESGEVLQRIGEGVAGFRDGALEHARFAYPQGLARSGDNLYVADTGNHAIRHIDLASGSVTTLAGTGKVGYDLNAATNARTVSLRSPWDLALRGSELYIAMAGSHQVWAMSLDDGNITPFAGSGGEGLRNGALERATFSQPSGLALSGDRLFVADAEASAIREIDLAEGKVRTLLGKGLFEFGDEDGKQDVALLQHPLGVAMLNGTQLLIADSYNHKIKRYDLGTGELVTLVGNGEPGDLHRIDEASLNEPAAVAVSGNRVWIADTNNDRVVSFSLGDRQLRPLAVGKKR